MEEESFFGGTDNLRDTGKTPKRRRVKNAISVALVEGAKGVLDLAELADVIDDSLDWACASERFPRPRIVVEPGRAVSARA